MKEETVPKKEAMQQLKNMITRTALLHYAFTQTLIEELGEKKGRRSPSKPSNGMAGLSGKRRGKKLKKRGFRLRAKIFRMISPLSGGILVRKWS